MTIFLKTGMVIVSSINKFPYEFNLSFFNSVNALNVIFYGSEIKSDTSMHSLYF